MLPQSRTINREQSWLEFNQRVLDEAICPDKPLLERLKFLAITASNLDEFFMVRVGGLKIQAGRGAEERDATGLTPAEQLDRIGSRVRAMVQAQYDCLLQHLEPGLAARGLKRVRPQALTGSDRDALASAFVRRIEPILTPIGLSKERPRSPLRPLALYLLLRLDPDPKGPKSPRFAAVRVDAALDRYVPLAADRGHRYILVEDVVRLFASRLFGGQRVRECVPFRVTRNADMAVDEDGDLELLESMADVLRQRRKSPCVRLEIHAGATVRARRFLMQELGLDEADVYDIPGPLDLADFMVFTSGWSGIDGERLAKWTPRQPVSVDPHESMFSILSRRDVLLHHPYESYSPVVRLVQEAATDADVLAIKMTLYRTSRQSPIVEALCRAALEGKYVTAVVELKARFDEHRNILWAKQLEDAGVRVVHGVRGLKTHAKCCMIVRREASGIVRYLHFGTGNYNEVTAGLYADVSFMTRNEELGQDATAFFNAATGYSIQYPFAKLAMAPTGLRERFVDLIRAETTRAGSGQKALIMAKMNALVDEEIIEALYAASAAGVTVRLNVRGICCLRPGVPGLSENIRVVSIVDRFLEHSRIFCFSHAGEERVFLSSADWMPRNLDRRIELLVPVEDPALRQRLVRILETCCSDTVKGRAILADGSYRPMPPAAAGRVSSQEIFCREACEGEQEMAQHRRTVFEPHRPSTQG